jgi:hypothetical protein
MIRGYEMRKSKRGEFVMEVAFERIVLFEKRIVILMAS